MTGAQVWLWVGWTLAAAGAVVCALALFRDRAKGRHRCPKCWYDMSGAVGVGVSAGEGARCPECGAVAKGERLLTRTHRRWGWVAVGAVLMLLAYPAGQEPLLRAGTWREAVPTWVIVYVWPLDFDTWEKTGKEPMIDELVYVRLNDPTKNVWAARVVVGTLEERASRGMQSLMHGGKHVVRSFDCTPHWDALGRRLETEHGGGGGAMYCFGTPPKRSQLPSGSVAAASRGCADSLLELVESCVHSEDWRGSGGEKGTLLGVGPFIVVDGPEEMVDDAMRAMDRFVAYAALVKSGTTEPPVQIFSEGDKPLRAYSVAPLLATAIIERESDHDDYGRTSLLLTLEALVLERVDADSWRENGGEDGYMQVHVETNTLLVSHRPEVHAQIERYLKSLEGTRWWDPPQAAGDAALSPK